MEHKDSSLNYIESLFTSKEISRIFFDDACDAIIFTEDLKVVDCNKRAYSMLGLKAKKEITGRFLYEYSPDLQPDDSSSNPKAQHLFTGNPDETSHTFYLKFIRTDKTTIETEVTLNYISHEGRTFQKFTIYDVNDQKRREKELIEAESKYKKIFENVQDVFYRTDLNGIITEISPSIEKYSKYIHADVLGEPIDKFYHNPDDRIRLINEIKEKGEALDFEVLLKGKNGQLVWGSVNAHFLFDESGTVNGVEGTIRDLTDRKQAEEKSRLSLSMLQATLDSTTDGILVVNLLGKITSYNKPFTLIFNLSEEILESGDDTAAIRAVLDLLEDPEQFVSKIQYLYENPNLESFDTIELKDGRILERYSCPQYLDGEPNGRVWNFRDVTVRKKAEQQLQLMAHTIKSINESISITDTNNRLLFVNAAFLKTYGYENEDELIGQNITVVRSPDNDPEMVNQILSITKEKGWQGEIINRRKDGTDFPISLSTSIVQDESGKILGMVGVAVDITERKRFEEDLQKKEAHLRTLIQTIPDLIWLKDPNGVYLTCNMGFENFFGAPSSKIIGKTDYDFVDCDLADFFRRNDLKAIEAGKPTSNEEWITYATDGRKAMLETIKTPMYDTHGTLMGVLGIGRDITKRKLAEESLRQSEIKYRNLIETMPDGFYRSTPEGRFVDVNEAMVKMLGYDSKEDLMAIDIPSQLYFKREDRESLVLQINPEELDVYPLKKKDGSAVWVEDHGWYVKNEAGNIVYHEGVSRNVTERKTTEMQLLKFSEELKELNATKDKFFSIIAHDLKTPFNSILGLSEILKDEAKHLDIATIEQYSGIIHSTSKNTFRLLENLLDWARIQQSQISFHPAPVILKKTVNDIVEMMVEKANSKMIAVINYVPSKLIVTADENMLKTVLRNLISNALKFTPVNGKIEIRAVLVGNTVEVSIEDTGTGMTKEDIGKIFKIGSSFSKRGTENEKGTGLGLMLCKEFVEKHGGKIWIESEVGKGSTFTFTIKQSEFLTNQSTDEQFS